MAIGDDIIQPIPAVGTSGTSYASQLVAFLQEVKSRLESRVPLSSILPGLLDMANNAIANLEYASLYEQETEPATPIGSLQNYQGNLWWVSDSGAAQLTSGNNLNAAALGGIDGDYGGGNPASFRFVDADETFYAYDDFGAGDWAWLGARGLYIYGAENSTTRVKLTAANGTDNYTLTLPTALPATQKLLQIEADGELVYSNVLGVDENITLSGNGKILHDQYSVTCPIIRGSDITPSGIVTYSSPGSQPGATVGTSTTTYFPLCHGIENNKTITGFTVFLQSPPPAGVTYTLMYDDFAATLGGWVSTGITTSSISQHPSATADFANNGTALYLKVVTTGSGGCEPLYVQLGFKSE